MQNYQTCQMGHRGQPLRCCLRAVCAAVPDVSSIPRTNLVPESITWTSDGTIIFGSVGTNSIWRVPAGKREASRNGSNPKHQAIFWACSRDPWSNRLLVCQGGVQTFDLQDRKIQRYADRFLQQFLSATISRCAKMGSIFVT